MTQSSPDNKIGLHSTALLRQLDPSLPLDEFYSVWLSLLALQLNRAVRAVLVLGAPDSNAYQPVAYWPEGQGGSAVLAELAEQALELRQGIAGQIDESAKRSGVAYPLIIDEHLHGVVVVEIGGLVNAAVLDQALQSVRWGCGWIEARLRGDQAYKDAAMQQLLVTALELIVSSLEQEGFQASAKAVVTELAQRLNCERVSIGFSRGDHIRVEAISHSAELDKQMNVVIAIGRAMDESFDQLQPVSFPETEEQHLITRQHQALAQQFGSGVILTLPLYVSGEANGALLFERAPGKPFTAEEVELCRSVATVVSPILHEKWLNDRNFLQRSRDSIRDGLRTALGPQHYLRKLFVLAAATLVLAGIFIPGDYRVTADTVIEGKIQRSIVTPFDGYVIEAQARAGDVVKQGQLLARLEDKDLQLEKLKWQSQRDQLSKQYDEAMAMRDRAKVNIIAAQIDQAEAQLNLAQEQLARTVITAPFDGIVISGDLSQMLGGSVPQGERLFVVAPLDDYRVILQVNERSIQQLQAGQQGTLVLSSLPDQEMELIVERITPVSSAADGENFFRVEARLQQRFAQLRPGMEGVAKVDIGERSLLWIWTHDIITWLHLWLWRWIP